MVNDQRPDDRDYIVAEEPDVEGHVMRHIVDGEPDAEDTEGHRAYYLDGSDEADDTEGHVMRH